MPDAELHSLLRPLLKERIQERIGSDGDALALSMRIIVCDFVGIRNEVDFARLLPLQCEDGGWELSWMYRYPSNGTKIGNRGFTTALALTAVEIMSRLEKNAEISRPVSPVLKKLQVDGGERKGKHHRRRSSLKESIQWVMHVTKVDKLVQ